MPWFVVSAFAGSAVIAVIVGFRSRQGEVAEAATVTRTAGIVYAMAVAVVIGLWVREKF